MLELTPLLIATVEDKDASPAGSARVPIISGIPRGISKLIFVQGSYESLAMPNGKTRQGPFFYDSIL